jgi:hypothetical protein
MPSLYHVGYCGVLLREGVVPSSAAWRAHSRLQLWSCHDSESEQILPSPTSGLQVVRMTVGKSGSVVWIRKSFGAAFRLLSLQPYPSSSD